MNSKNLLLSAVVFFAATSFFSCASTTKVAKQITVGSGEIPPDMRKEDFVLLGIIKGNPRYDKVLEKNFLQYKGNYKLCTLEELQSTLTDKEQYRYILDYTIGMSSSVATAKGMLFKGYRFYILDRKTNKKYKRQTRSSFANLEIKAYLKAIDAARKN